MESVFCGKMIRIGTVVSLVTLDGSYICQSICLSFFFLSIYLYHPHNFRCPFLSCLHELDMSSPIHCLTIGCILLSSLLYVSALCDQLSSLLLMSFLVFPFYIFLPHQSSGTSSPTCHTHYISITT